MINTVKNNEEEWQEFESTNGKNLQDIIDDVKDRDATDLVSELKSNQNSREDAVSREDEQTRVDDNWYLDVLS